MSIGTVTIVVPTYQRPGKLERAIRSILAQTYRDIQVLVFDNASGDSTSEIVAGLIASDSRVSYHCHSENVGLINNFNFAVSQVKTPFFGFLTDDDYFLPNFIEDAMLAFQNHPQAQVSFLSAPSVKEDGTFLSDQLDAWPREGLYAFGESISKAVDGFHPIITMCIFRLALIGEVQFDKKTDRIADIPILISILAKYPFHLSKKVGGYFIRHEKASGNDFSRVANVQGICDAFIRVEEIFEGDATLDLKIKEEVIRGLRDRIDKLFLNLLMECLYADESRSFYLVYKKYEGRRWSRFRICGVMLYAFTTLVGSKFAGDALKVLRSMLGRSKK